MLSLCSECDKLLGEGDDVKVVVRSKFHILKSTVTFALDKHAMVCDPRTLRHTNCQYPQGEPEGD
jgi:hypothetical protein